jgi:hypothetical protein
MLFTPIGKTPRQRFERIGQIEELLMLLKLRQRSRFHKTSEQELLVGGDEFDVRLPHGMQGVRLFTPERRARENYHPNIPTNSPIRVAFSSPQHAVSTCVALSLP